MEESSRIQPCGGCISELTPRVKVRFKEGRFSKRPWRPRLVGGWKTAAPLAPQRPASTRRCTRRDLLQLEQVRRPALLKQVFALAAAHPAEILSLEKIAGSLAEKGALETIAHYLVLLQQAFLVATLQKYAGDEIRRRRAPPKLVVLNNALLAGSRSAPPPTARSNPPEWGRWLENACLAHFVNSGQELYYWREEPWEVDGVSTCS